MFGRCLCARYDVVFFFFSSRRRHTRCLSDWSSDVCSSDLNFVNASEEERELSLKRSSELNDAYRVLRDPLARVEYLLEIEGERKEGETKQQAPPELLEEVFELNESLDELREAKESGGNLAELKTKLQAAENNFQAKLD